MITGVEQAHKYGHIKYPNDRMSAGPVISQNHFRKQLWLRWAGSSPSPVTLETALCVRIVYLQVQIMPVSSQPQLLTFDTDYKFSSLWMGLPGSISRMSFFVGLLLGWQSLDAGGNYLHTGGVTVPVFFACFLIKVFQAALSHLHWSFCGYWYFGHSGEKSR